jgi:hypothetical protein
MAILRPSDIGAWTLCPKRLELKDTQSEYPSYAMSRGSLLHARIEHHLTRGKTFNAYDEYDQIVSRDTHGNVEALDLPAGKVADLIVETEYAYQTWLTQVAPTIEKFGDDIVVEHRLERELGAHTMGGTPDLVVPGEKLIIDWKTANRQWKDTKAEGELQPPAYTWLNDWAEATFVFWVCDMSNYQWKAHKVVVTDIQVDAWWGLANEVGNAVDAGIYAPTPSGQSWTGVRGWHCSPKYCSAWNVCDAKHLIADMQGIQVRDPKGEWI